MKPEDQSTRPNGDGNKVPGRGKSGELLRFLRKTIILGIISFLLGGLFAFGQHRLPGVFGFGKKSEQAIYIPKDLEDCFGELKKILKPQDVEKMKAGPEDDLDMYHHGLGTWLRNNWGLWEGSRLSAWFNRHGIEHPDNMSGIILTSFWRHLNGQPIGLEAQLKYYGGDPHRLDPDDEDYEPTEGT